MPTPALASPDRRPAPAPCPVHPERTISRHGVCKRCETSVFVAVRRFEQRGTFAGEGTNQRGAVLHAHLGSLSVDRQKTIREIRVAIAAENSATDCDDTNASDDGIDNDCDGINEVAVADLEISTDGDGDGDVDTDGDAPETDVLDETDTDGDDNDEDIYATASSDDDDADADGDGYDDNDGDGFVDRPATSYPGMLAIMEADPGPPLDVPPDDCGIATVIDTVHCASCGEGTPRSTAIIEGVVAMCPGCIDGDGDGYADTDEEVFSPAERLRLMKAQRALLDAEIALVQLQADAGRLAEALDARSESLVVALAATLQEQLQAFGDPASLKLLSHLIGPLTTALAAGALTFKCFHDTSYWTADDEREAV